MCRLHSPDMTWHRSEGKFSDNKFSAYFHKKTGKNQPLQSEGTTGDMGKVNSVGISSVDKTHSQIFVAKDDDTAAAAASRTALPSPPPNTSALQAAQHLCYDEDGNAFYFNDLTGEPTPVRVSVVLLRQSNARESWSNRGRVEFERWSRYLRRTCTWHQRHAEIEAP